MPNGLPPLTLLMETGCYQCFPHLLIYLDYSGIYLVAIVIAYIHIIIIFEVRLNNSYNLDVMRLTHAVLRKYLTKTL